MKNILAYSSMTVMVILMTSCLIVSEDIGTAPPPTPTRVPPTNLPIFGAIDVRIWPDGMQGLYVPEGEFKMGPEKEGRLADTIYLDAFWIDQTEVTNAMYEKCVAAGACSPPSRDDTHTSESYYGDSQYADYPVVYVNWFQAQAYCNWMGRRLPTEAEWEKAARGTDARKYPWGEQPPDCNLANYGTCGNYATPVDSHLAGASPYGALDMAGNVWEWTSSLKWGYPYDANDGRENLDTSDGARVLRGGSWSYIGDNFGTTHRSNGFPESSYDYIGFRCAH